MDEGENYEQVEAEIKAKILDLAVTFDERAEIAFRKKPLRSQKKIKSGIARQFCLLTLTQTTTQE